ncbi:MAG TPA: EamA family transporter [Patescibacteria group bacterium]|nr:EamA family transporter [Patescibacteria group bacterium]
MNAYFELILASIIFASGGVFVKILHLPSTTLTFFRVGVPTIVLFIYLTAKKIPLFRGNNKLVLIASALNAVRLLMYFIAYTMATIGNASLMTATTPIFIFIYSYFFLKEKISRKRFFLLALAISGAVVLYSNQPISFGNKDFIGMTFALLSTALYAFTVIIFKKELSRYTKAETIFYQNVVGAFVFLPFLFINHPAPVLWQISLASVSGLLIGIVGFIFYFAALKKVAASAVSLASIDSVIAVLFGILFFKEHLTPNMVIGGACILTASLFIQKEMRKT